jgi:hypothetical protein
MARRACVRPFPAARVGCLRGGVIASALLLGASAFAQDLGPGLVPHGDVAQGNAGASDAQAAAPAGQHPLQPALELAQRGLSQLRSTIKDYSCTMVKRERIDGKLNDHEYMFAKVRHEPFSVYLYFLSPDSV